MTPKLKDFFDRKVKEFNQPEFIRQDPISIPHLFSKRQDIEIAGFFASIFAWGNRTTIIQKSHDLMRRMDMSPHQFCLQHDDKALKGLLGFKHRTFNEADLFYFIEFFKLHYSNNNSLESAFIKSLAKDDINVENALNGFAEYFFSLEDLPARTKKHIASPLKKSTCKRINMFLRWMVRNDNYGVDFGIWSKIKPSQLVCPLDIHVGRVARRFGLLTRKQTDWEAAVELTDYLKKFDANDPTKYDFALFGLGAMERYR